VVSGLGCYEHPQLAVTLVNALLVLASS